MFNKLILMSTSRLFSYLHFYINSRMFWMFITLTHVGRTLHRVRTDKVYLRINGGVHVDAVDAGLMD